LNTELLLGSTLKLTLVVVTIQLLLTLLICDHYYDHSDSQHYYNSLNCTQQQDFGFLNDGVINKLCQLSPWQYSRVKVLPQHSTGDLVVFAGCKVGES
jgi:hypothetical protein